MSDEQPPEAGSRRRRREIREARERARLAQRERESAVRRLSSHSTSEGSAAAPRQALFDQETQTPKDERSHRQHAPQPPAPRSADSAGQGPQYRQSTPGAEGHVTRRELRRLRTQQIPAQEPASETESAPRSAPASDSGPDPRPALARSPAAPTAGPSSNQLHQQPESAEQPAAPAPGGSTPSSAAQPGEAPATSSPSTPFEQVVAPHSVSPEPVDEDAAFPPEVSGAGSPEEFDNYDDDWDAASEGYVADDEDGTPLLVSASGFGRSYQTVAPVEAPVNRNLLKRRQAKRRRRNVTLTIALGGFAVLVIGFVLVVRSFLTDDTVNDYETQAGETVQFEVVDGDGFESVAARLVEREIIASGEAFWDSLQQLENEPTPQPGTFDIREQMPADDAVEALFDDAPAADYVALNPGTQIDDALSVIAQGTGVSRQELEGLNEDPQQFGLPEEAETLEGYLAAGEYHPELDATAEEVIEEMVAPTFEYFEELGLSEEDEQWRTVIVASLITAEADHGQPEDYPRIAGAIENRLDPSNNETGGRLEIDAAVNYGIEGETGLHFTDEARQDESNPYNTYQHEGLPPGPIATPTFQTMEAAVNPDDNDYLYWVTVNIATGETRFNVTYSDHEEDVEEFLRWCREEDEDELCGPADLEAAEDVVEE